MGNAIFLRIETKIIDANNVGVLHTLSEMTMGRPKTWTILDTCVRSSGLPVGSHGIVVRRAQKSGHDFVASLYWITSSGLASVTF